MNSDLSQSRISRTDFSYAELEKEKLVILFIDGQINRNEYLRRLKNYNKDKRKKIDVGNLIKLRQR